MRIPKSILISGVNYRVIFDKKINGGYFEWKEHIIKIEKGISKERQWAIFIHEISEVIMVETNMRYKKCLDGDIHNGDYLFVFTHDDFENFTNVLAGILKEGSCA